VGYGIYRLTGMELIDGMMKANPEDRYDIADVKRHEFVANAPNISEEELKGMIDAMDQVVQ